MELPQDILLIDKPKGITSFDVIRRLRTQTGVRKFGHAGTLDPLASGLMIVGREQGTKHLNDFLKLDKEYIADIRIGESRTTGDLEGSIIEEKEVTDIPSDRIEAALQKLVGEIELSVSAYSAIKKDGQPLYKKARKAEKVGEIVHDLPLRVMHVYEAQLQDVHTEIVDGKNRVVATVRFHVGSGTYIRSLAEALGKLLEYPATLQDLRRTKIGEWRVEDSQSI